MSPRIVCAFVALVALAPLPSAADWVKFGSGGFGSKWDDPVHPNPGVATWGFVADGTTVTPSFYLADEVVGGSDVTQLRADFDAVHGAGAFDAALARAFDTWSRVAGITFVGPIADGGGAFGATGATSPDIRIAAFAPLANSGFSFVGAVGFGPPGDDLNFPDPVAGDIAFNLAQPLHLHPGAEGAPFGVFANDLEGLMLHELGHAAIGLGHPAAGPEEVMFVGAGCCAAINREPSPDDIAGARSVYGASATPACANGLDDDGDGGKDFAPASGAADTGCMSASDASEKGALLCDDGLDNDGDSGIDFRSAPFAGDIGCASAQSDIEAPQCQDGLDNDLDATFDFDGGASANDGAPLGAPDSECVAFTQDLEVSDLDGDGVEDTADNCPYFPNPGQSDVGGVGAAAPPDGIGDACQCGDVSGNGRVTTADATLITRSLLVPPTATLARPDLCDVNGNGACTTADAVITTRSLLVPPTTTIQQACPATQAPQPL